MWPEANFRDNNEWQSSILSSVFAGLRRRQFIQ
jgi:hypothetical protein